ncbi:MAG: glycosyltransferase family 1 protein [Anaerolineae bacterium CG_4_9_14_3_um_filter_57_17]|nr:glycosyltransferase family 4 protein [bacterium]NCT21064.1 glycosyltransferase family 4 protein [bacterium]OIO87466.1 MAG: glycosyl transferase family 1 [Anaerolineae bacterium CG2_30_57_67]PJB66385.1 MAG: glycosyltransferase family 1 protein [Anaerolineae bacterium CG_4_9_14_3_um_filter_57_17]
MKILTVLTYYRPHTSGLTIYAERLAEAFARRGHQVTVLTAHFDPATPREETRNGVRIIRAPVLLRVSKGVIMPTLGWLAWKYVAENDVVQLHLPQFDAPGFAARARLLGKKTILTYHCDIQLPPGFFNRVVNAVVDFQNHMAGMLADHIVTYTQDYADHSAYLAHYRHKLTPILPPVVLPPAEEQATRDFFNEHVGENRPIIGMAARFAAEKGVEILLDALPAILQKYPKARVLFAGQHQNVLGEKAYAARLQPKIRAYEDSGHWQWLGVLNPTQMAAFYPNLNALVVPSLNSTEAFGLVQIEAMLNGVPCVASALPGVRRPVQMTGMGKVAPIGDSAALAQALLEIFAAPANFHRDPAEIARPYDPDAVAAAYEEMMNAK